MKFPNPFGKTEMPEEKDSSGKKEIVPTDSPAVSSSEEMLQDIEKLEVAIRNIETVRNELAEAIAKGDPAGKKLASLKLKEHLRIGKAVQRKVLGEKPAKTLSADFRLKDDSGKESVETIIIDFEQRLRESADFYRKHGIAAEDFESEMEDIWERNHDQIREQIEKFGFDEILLIPEGVPLSELHEKMSKGYSATHEWSGFKDAGSFAGVIEDRKGLRIVLLHKKNAQNIKDHPLLKKTLGKTAEAIIAEGEKLTLAEYLIFQRQYFEEFDKHPDADGWTWLPGSKSGTRVPGASWDPGGGQLYVHAAGADYSNSNLGGRLSRSFS